MDQAFCRTFWGSHGCALPEGHPDNDRRHQCGLAADDDGVCSVVTLEDGRWVVRYDVGLGIKDTDPSWPTELYITSAT